MAEYTASIEPFFTWDSSNRAHDALLVIGNGFDIECGLPTRYTDFLDFACFLENVYNQLLMPIGLVNTPKEIDTLGRFLSAKGLSRLKATFEAEVNRPNSDPAQTNALLRRILANDSALLNDIAQQQTSSDWGLFIDMVPEGLRPKVMEQLASGEIPFCDWSPLFGNYWYRHFKKVQIGKRWIDFEAEIARVIKALEYSMIDGRAHRAYADDKVSCTQPFELEGLDLPSISFMSAELDRSGSIHTYPTTYREIRDSLLSDLKVLTDRLECYLRDYVEGIPVKETSAITHMLDSLQGIDAKNVRILNFNYTSTLERLLNGREMSEAITCHVHGQVDGGSRVVLGMDEYLPDEEIASCIDFASFRKYNQRIQRRADNSYMQWIERQWSYATTAHEVIVFGHSIGASDWDLLRPLIKKEKPYGGNIEGVRTAVYYYNDDAFSEILANVTGMLGKNYVIERTGPKSRTLEFIDQQGL